MKDPEIYPDEKVLRAELGRAYPAYESWCKAVKGPDLQLQAEWRYYRDGGWLCKITRKKTTVCWLSVASGAFRVGFYFNAKTCGGIPNLPIDTEKKQAFAEAKAVGKLQPLSFEISSEEALSDAIVVAQYKVSVS